MWCIPAQDNAAFVCQMEAVLEVFKRPQAPRYPVVCMDETSVQCIREVRPPIAARPGRTERYDVEYERNGVAHLLDKLEFVYTPKHGSWLNMAECEFSVLSRQCLARRLPDRNTVTRETAAWVDARNQVKKPVDWRFTTEDARIN